MDLTPIEEMDGRTIAARKIKATLEAWSREYNGATMSESQRICARRCAVLLLSIEEMEARFLNDGEKLPANYVSSVALAERLMGKLERQRSLGSLAA